MKANQTKKKVRSFSYYREIKETEVGDNRAVLYQEQEETEKTSYWVQHRKHSGKMLTLSINQDK